MTTSERLEWLKTRQTGIGGSDVAAILGLSKWKTPLDVYNDKIAEPPLKNPTLPSNGATGSSPSSARSTQT